MKRKYIPMADVEEAIKTMARDIASMAETTAELTFVRRIVGPARNEALSRLSTAPSIETDPLKDPFVAYVEDQVVQQIADRLEDDASAVVSINDVSDKVVNNIVVHVCADELLQEQICHAIWWHVEENLPAEYFDKGQEDADDE